MAAPRAHPPIGGCSPLSTQTQEKSRSKTQLLPLQLSKLRSKETARKGRIVTAPVLGAGESPESSTRILLLK